MSSALSLSDVRRSFGRKPVLRGISAEAEAGAVIGLLGRNGEGKTTLFKIILDMLAADQGSVAVQGRRPDGTGAIRQHIGYIPERPAFHPFMTVGEVLSLRSRFFARWDEGRARKMCSELELDPGVRVREASKGTLGKLAWVCAAAHDPEVYLLDEPTSGLDALVREKVLDQLIAKLHESGRTILVANHRMEELAGVLDAVWVMRDGRIRSTHSVEDLRTQACRLTGRLKEGARLPKGLPVVPVPGDSPLVELVVFERSMEEMLSRSGAFQRLDRTPLPLEDSLKFLLQGTDSRRKP